MADHNDIMMAIGKLQGEVSTLTDTMTKAVDRLDFNDRTIHDRISKSNDNSKEVEKKINTLEKKVYGITLIGSGVVSFLMAYIKNLIS